jgi:hypothetical protein
MEDPEISDLAVMMMAGVLWVPFNRTADDLYTLASGQLPEPAPGLESSQKFNDDSAALNDVEIWAAARFRGNCLLHSAIMRLVGRM